MSLGVYIQNQGFVVQVGTRFDSNYQRGYQIHMEVWRGAHAGLDDFLEYTKPIGSVHPDYPLMYLAEQRPTAGIGYTSVELVYYGFRSADDLDLDGDTGIVNLNDATDLVNVSVFTDEADENVDFKYYAPTTTVGYIHSGEFPPQTPKFPGTLVSGVSIQLFDPWPPTYTGTPQTKFELRNIGFARTRIAPNLWAVTEVNQVRVEPDVVLPIVVNP